MVIFGQCVITGGIEVTVSVSVFFAGRPVLRANARYAASVLRRNCYPSRNPFLTRQNGCDAMQMQNSQTRIEHLEEALSTAATWAKDAIEAGQEDRLIICHAIVHLAKATLQEDVMQPEPIGAE
jgi:hypothetical protein